MMLLIFAVLWAFALTPAENYEVLVPPTPTNAQLFPYHAVIETEGWWCNGVIINDEYVLTRASCIISDKETKVYLGFTRNPYFQGNLNDPAGQTFHVIKRFIHDEFGTLHSHDQFINNLAIIQLHKPLVRTPTVQLIPLATPDDFPIPPGTYMNVTGFPSHEDDTNLHYATVQMRDVESCVMFYEDTFVKTQERCVRQQGLQRLRWAGPYVVNGTLVGLQRSLHADAKCFVSSPPCDVHDVFLSFKFFLEWAYRISALPTNGSVYFQFNNPYWQYRPERIKRESITMIKDTVVDLEVNVQTCKQNENAFVAALKNAIEKSQSKGLKHVSFEIDLN